MRKLLLTAALGFLATAATAADVSFEAGPSATKVADGVRITFTVSTATDAEVAVLDAKGKVVRHLGAAALGAKKATPPFGPGLSQSIPWDMLDDAGKPATGGPFKLMQVAVERVQATQVKGSAI